MFTVLVMALMFVGLIAQFFVGFVPGLGSHVLPLPLFFLCGAAALPLWTVLWLSLVGGLMWDCLTVIPIDGRTELPFGSTVVLYAAIGVIMNGLRPMYLRGWWYLQVVMLGLLVSLLVLIEFVVITFRREPFALIWPTAIWQRIGGSGLVAAILSIPVFLILNWIGRRLGIFNPQRLSA